MNESRAVKIRLCSAVATDSVGHYHAGDLERLPVSWLLHKRVTRADRDVGGAVLPDFQLATNIVLGY